MTTNLVFDLFDRTVASGWGTSSSGLAWTVSGGAASLYNVGSGVGTIQVEAAGAAIRQAFLAGLSVADVDWAYRFACDKAAAGNYIAVGTEIRRVDASNYLVAEVRLNTAGGIDVAAVSRVAGVETTVATASTGLLHTPGAFYRVRANMVGTQMAIKVWYDGSAEPGVPQLTATVATISAANPGGLRALLATGNTTPLSVTATFDDLSVNTGVTYLGLPYPVSGDAFCGTGLPAVNAVEQLAESVQAWLTANIDPGLATVQLYEGPQRVRISRDVFTIPNASSNPDLDTVEFNVGTPTDLSITDSSVRLPPGIWLTWIESVASPSSDTTGMYMQLASGVLGANATYVVNTSLGELYGGGGKAAALVRAQAPVVTPVSTFSPIVVTGPTAMQYVAMTAVRISDLF